MTTSDNHTSTRVCRKCSNPYPLTPEYFYKDKSCPAGFQTACKECVKEKQRQWHNDNREHANAYAKARYHNEPEKRAAYRETHAEQIAATKRNWRLNNPDKVKAQKQRSHIRRRDHNNARTMRWYAANSDKSKAASIAWNRNRYAIDPEFRAMHKAKAHRRRMVVGELTKELILELYGEQEGRCVYCGITLHDDYTLEHITPISRGGTNERDNLACACPRCNYSKNDKLLSEWQAVRGW